MLFKIVYFIFRGLPSSNSLNKLRGYLLGLFMQGTKKNLKIGRAVNLTCPENIYLGNNITINAECTFVATPNGKITIGNDVLIAPRCYIQTQNHNYIDKTILIKNQGVLQKDVFIGNDVWLAYQTIVLPGVSIANGSVIGAGSIINKDTLPYSVSAGIPAKLIKFRE